MNNYLNTVTNASDMATRAVADSSEATPVPLHFSGNSIKPDVFLQSISQWHLKEGSRSISQEDLLSAVLRRANTTRELLSDCPYPNGPHNDQNPHRIAAIRPEIIPAWGTWNPLLSSHSHRQPQQLQPLPPIQDKQNELRNLHSPIDLQAWQSKTTVQGNSQPHQCVRLLVQLVESNPAPPSNADNTPGRDSAGPLATQSLIPRPTTYRSNDAYYRPMPANTFPPVTHGATMSPSTSAHLQNARGITEFPLFPNASPKPPYGERPLQASSVMPRMEVWQQLCGGHGSSFAMVNHGMYDKQAVHNDINVSTQDSRCLHLQQQPSLNRQFPRPQDLLEMPEHQPWHRLLQQLQLPPTTQLQPTTPQQRPKDPQQRQPLPPPPSQHQLLLPQRQQAQWERRQGQITEDDVHQRIAPGEYSSQQGDNHLQTMQRWAHQPVSQSVLPAIQMNLVQHQSRQSAEWLPLDERSADHARLQGKQRVQWLQPEMSPLQPPLLPPQPEQQQQQQQGHEQEQQQQQYHHPRTVGFNGHLARSGKVQDPPLNLRSTQREETAFSHGCLIDTANLFSTATTTTTAGPASRGTDANDNGLSLDLVWGDPSAVSGVPVEVVSKPLVSETARTGEAVAAASRLMTARGRGRGRRRGSHPGAAPLRGRGRRSHCAVQAVTVSAISAPVAPDVELNESLPKPPEPLQQQPLGSASGPTTFRGPGLLLRILQQQSTGGERMAPQEPSASFLQSLPSGPCQQQQKKKKKQRQQKQQQGEQQEGEQHERKQLQQEEQQPKWRLRKRRNQKLEEQGERAQEDEEQQQQQLEEQEQEQKQQDEQLKRTLRKKRDKQPEQPGKLQQEQPTEEQPQNRRTRKKNAQLLSQQLEEELQEEEELPKKKPTKRARVLKEGQLSLIVYGYDEKVLWARRVGWFIRAMRTVLGDRTLRSRWGGSVVDSVVGTFLTQNAADVLSSAAFMNLAAAFPGPRSQAFFAANRMTAAGKATAAVAASATIMPTTHAAVMTGKPAATADSMPYSSYWIPEGEDIVDWETVRTAPDDVLAELIRCRGMHLMLAKRIKAFLNHVYEEGEAAAAAAAAPPSDLDNDNGTGVAEEPVVQQTLFEDPDVAVVSSSGAAVATAGTTVESSTNDVDSGSSADAGRRSPIRLEWLRCVSAEEATKYLMSVDGLGRKSAACITLLTLYKKEFPVDINVARVFARLGWIPIEAEATLEQLDSYSQEPEVHKYLHSRLMAFDLETLYELHYQSITLGKVFCQKRAPNCGCCPLASQCDYAIQGGNRLKLDQPRNIVLQAPVPPSRPSSSKKVQTQLIQQNTPGLWLQQPMPLQPAVVAARLDGSAKPTSVRLSKRFRAYNKQEVDDVINGGDSDMLTVTTASVMVPMDDDDGVAVVAPQPSSKNTADAFSGGNRTSAESASAAGAAVGAGARPSTAVPPTTEAALNVATLFPAISGGPSQFLAFEDEGRKKANPVVANSDGGKGQITDVRMGQLPQAEALEAEDVALQQRKLEMEKLLSGLQAHSPRQNGTADLSCTADTIQDGPTVVVGAVGTLDASTPVAADAADAKEPLRGMDCSDDGFAAAATTGATAAIAATAVAQAVAGEAKPRAPAEASSSLSASSKKLMLTTLLPLSPPSCPLDEIRMPEVRELAEETQATTAAGTNITDMEPPSSSVAAAAAATGVAADHDILSAAVVAAVVRENTIDSQTLPDAADVDRVMAVAPAEEVVEKVQTAAAADMADAPYREEVVDTINVASLAEAETVNVPKSGITGGAAIAAVVVDTVNTLGAAGVTDASGAVDGADTGGACDTAVAEDAAETAVEASSSYTAVAGCAAVAAVAADMVNAIGAARVTDTVGAMDGADTGGACDTAVAEDADETTLAGCKVNVARARSAVVKADFADTTPMMPVLKRVAVGELAAGLPPPRFQRNRSPRRRSAILPLLTCPPPSTASAADLPEALSVMAADTRTISAAAAKLKTNTVLVQPPSPLRRTMYDPEFHAAALADAYSAADTGKQAQPLHKPVAAAAAVAAAAGDITSVACPSQVVAACELEDLASMQGLAGPTTTQPMDVARTANVIACKDPMVTQDCSVKSKAAATAALDNRSLPTPRPPPPFSTAVMSLTPYPRRAAATQADEIIRASLATRTKAKSQSHILRRKQQQQPSWQPGNHAKQSESPKPTLPASVEDGLVTAVTAVVTVSSMASAPIAAGAEIEFQSMALKAEDTAIQMLTPSNPPKKDTYANAGSGAGSVRKKVRSRGKFKAAVGAQGECPTQDNIHETTFAVGVGSGGGGGGGDVAVGRTPSEVTTQKVSGLSCGGEADRIIEGSQRTSSSRQCSSTRLPQTGMEMEDEKMRSRLGAAKRGEVQRTEPDRKRCAGEELVTVSMIRIPNTTANGAAGSNAEAKGNGGISSNGAKRRLIGGRSGNGCGGVVGETHPVTPVTPPTTPLEQLPYSRQRPARQTRLPTRFADSIILTSSIINYHIRRTINSTADAESPNLTLKPVPSHPPAPNDILCRPTEAYEAQMWAAPKLAKMAVEVAATVAPPPPPTPVKVGPKVGRPANPKRAARTGWKFKPPASEMARRDATAATAVAGEGTCADNLATGPQPPPPSVPATATAFSTVTETVAVLSDPMDEPSNPTSWREVERILAIVRLYEEKSTELACVGGGGGLPNEHSRMPLAAALEVLGSEPPAMLADGAKAVRQRYLELSVAVHPDKCRHPLASDAFAALTKALAVARQAACATGAVRAPASGTAAVCDDPSAVVTGGAHFGSCDCVADDDTDATTTMPLYVMEPDGTIRIPAAAKKPLGRNAGHADTVHSAALPLTAGTTAVFRTSTKMAVQDPNLMDIYGSRPYGSQERVIDVSLDTSSPHVVVATATSNGIATATATAGPLGLPLRSVRLRDTKGPRTRRLVMGLKISASVLRNIAPDLPWPPSREPEGSPQLQPQPRTLYPQELQPQPHHHDHHDHHDREVPAPQNHQTFTNIENDYMPYILLLLEPLKVGPSLGDAPAVVEPSSAVAPTATSARTTRTRSTNRSAGTAISAVAPQASGMATEGPTLYSTGGDDPPNPAVSTTTVAALEVNVDSTQNSAGRAPIKGEPPPRRLSSVQVLGVATDARTIAAATTPGTASAPAKTVTAAAAASVQTGTELGALSSWRTISPDVAVLPALRRLLQLSRALVTSTGERSGRQPTQGHEAEMFSERREAAELYDIQLRAAVLIPCRAALRGGFPLNGTYFQTNELFLVEHTAQQPLRFRLGQLLGMQMGSRVLGGPLPPELSEVAPELLAAFQGSTAVYFGHATSSITRDMTAAEVAVLFEEGAVCVRSFCVFTGYPRPIPAFLSPPSSHGSATGSRGRRTGGSSRRRTADAELSDDNE